MRLRLKKHLNEREDNVKEYLIECGNLEANHIEAAKNKQYLDVFELFGNDNPIVLEIGCGMGAFAVGYCKQNKGVNLVGVEMIRNVLVVAMEKAKQNGLKNAKFMNMTAEYLPKFFKKGQIERVFLNFSTPYPKEKQRNKRLTHSRFLKEYEYLLKDNGEVWQKTDDLDFFEYSLEQFKLQGWDVYEITYDLHGDNVCDNVITEYESKFVAQNKKICRLKARKPKDN